MPSAQLSSLPIVNAVSAFNVLWRCIFGIDTEYIINMLYLPGKSTDCHPIGQLQGTWNKQQHDIDPHIHLCKFSIKK
jgi:hypothetical protein